MTSSVLLLMDLGKHGVSTCTRAFKLYLSNSFILRSLFSFYFLLLTHFGRADNFFDAVITKSHCNLMLNCMIVNYEL